MVKMNEFDLKLKTEFENLPADFWDFKQATTRDLTHGLHYYPAIMVYPISQNILNIVKKHITVNSLMDPFMGSGTVLVEGMIGNIPQIYGTDLNPLAVLMSRVKTTKLSQNQLAYITQEHKIYLENIKEKSYAVANDFDSYIRNELQLDVTAKKGWGDSADKYIDEYFKNKNKNFNYQTFTNLGFWFLPKTIILLQTIKNAIKKIEDVQIREFLLLAFSETVRTVSNTRNGEFKLFRMKPEKVAIFNPDVFEEYFKVLNRNVNKMRDFIKVCSDVSNVHVNFDDTRSLTTIPDNSIDLVITSPPYGDSRTTVAYGQFSRLSLQWLDLDYTTQQDVANIDKNLLGGKPYCHKSQWAFLQSPTLLESLEKIAQKDVFRADDVFSFYVDLDKCLYAITNKMKPQSYQFWVVGNRTVKLEKLLTDKIISEMAVKYGLKHLFSFDRNIINKVMPSLNSPTNEVGERVKTMTSEIVVVLKKE